jgi:hypothetical protein
MTIPTVQVQLDDGTGTFPHDVSAYVLDLSISKGREDQFATVNPSTLSLTFDNTSGLFTLGTATYDIAINQKIRVKVNTVARFTGYVIKWPISWVGAPGKMALARITAADELARMGRHTMRSFLEETILEPVPRRYWTMGDPAGSLEAADSSGDVDAAPMTMGGTGVPATFGNAVGWATDGLTAAELDATDDAYFHGVCVLASGPRSVRASILSAPPPAPDYFAVIVADDATNGPFITIEGIDGHIEGSGGTVGPSINDGATHDVVVTCDGVNARLYLDGALIDTGASGMPGASTTVDAGGSAFGSLTCTLHHVAVYDSVLTADQVASMYAATQGTGPTTDFMESLAVITGAPVGTLDTSLTNAALPNVSGSSAGDVLNSLTAAEGGLAYFDGSGNLRFVNRNVRPLKLTPDMTISTTTSELISPDAEIEGDAADVVNFATVKRSAEGAPDITLQVPASVTAHGRQPMSETYWVGTDDEARDRAGWVVYNNDEPRPRIASLKLDAMTASAGEVTSLLTLDLGSRIRLSNLPSQAPSTTVDLHIDGWTETISIDEWSLDLNVTAWELQEAWLLDNATHSVLGTTTKLGV